MFGLFKKKVTPAEFGDCILHMANEWIGSDAGQSLGMRFDNFDGSEGLPIFLERHGVSLAMQKLYFRLYTHCAMQASFSQFEDRMAREMTLGAMSAFANNLEGYDFGATYLTLDAAYRGRHQFSPMVEPLTNSDARLSFLPNSNAVVLNSKYLIETFVLPNVSNSSAFFDDFYGYSSSMCATVGTVCRAMGQLSKSFRTS